AGVSVVCRGTAGSSSNKNKALSGLGDRIFGRSSAGFGDAGARAARGLVTSLLLPARITADDRKNLARNVARAARCCEKHKSRRYLFGLRWTLHWRIATEFGNPLRILVCGIKRSPHRTGCYGIDTDTVRNEECGERPREGMDGALGGRI